MQDIFFWHWTRGRHRPCARQQSRHASYRDVSGTGPWRDSAVQRDQNRRCLWLLPLATRQGPPDANVARQGPCATRRAHAVHHGTSGHAAVEAVCRFSPIRTLAPLCGYVETAAMTPLRAVEWLLRKPGPTVSRRWRAVGHPNGHARAQRWLGLSSAPTRPRFLSTHVLAGSTTASGWRCAQRLHAHEPIRWHGGAWSISVLPIRPHTVDSTVVAAPHRPARGQSPPGAQMSGRHAAPSKGGGGGCGKSRTISVRGGGHAPGGGQPRTAPPVSAGGYTMSMRARLVPVGWRPRNAPCLFCLDKRRRARRRREFQMRRACPNRRPGRAGTAVGPPRRTPPISPRETTNRAGPRRIPPSARAFQGGVLVCRGGRVSRGAPPRASRLTAAAGGVCQRRENRRGGGCRSHARAEAVGGVVAGAWHGGSAACGRL